MGEAHSASKRGQCSTGFASALAGQHVVGSRRELPLPASVRQMSGVVPGQPLLLAALVAHDLLVIHPAGAVARLLTDLHAQVIGGRRAG
jgi:hypothetical protein